MARNHRRHPNGQPTYAIENSRDVWHRLDPRRKLYSGFYLIPTRDWDGSDVEPNSYAARCRSFSRRNASRRYSVDVLASVGSGKTTLMAQVLGDLWRGSLPRISDGCCFCPRSRG